MDRAGIEYRSIFEHVWGGGGKCKSSLGTFGGGEVVVKVVVSLWLV